MKKAILSLFIIIIQNSVFAQTFLNPGFENNSASGCVYNLSNAMFNSYMSNVYAFGVYNNCDILGTACSAFGLPHGGNWFIALSVSGSQADAVAMELSQQLTPGIPYTITFYQKKDLSYNINPLEVGYSNDSSLFGTLITTIGSNVNTTWTQYVLTFAPTFAAKFITLQSVDSTYGWNHLDDFSIDFSKGIQERTKTTSVNIFPNPVYDELVVTLPAHSPESEIKIFDTLGKLEYAAWTTNGESHIDVSDMPGGIHIIQITAGDKVSKQKFIKQ